MQTFESSRSQPRERSRERFALSSRFWLVHAVLPALAFLVLLVAFQELPIDSYVARHWAYDATVNRWVGHGHWWADDLLHTDGRDAILLVIAGLLVTIGASTFSPRLRAGAWHGALSARDDCAGVGSGRAAQARDQRAVPVVAAGLRRRAAARRAVLATAGRLRQRRRASPAHIPRRASRCSRSTSPFGTTGHGARACCWRSRQPSACLFAFGQEARGAHFLSHDVCSAFLAWFVALGTYLVVAALRVRGGGSPCGARSARRGSNACRSIGAATPHAARVSSLIIASSRSKSGINGYSLTMRTWQITGLRSPNDARIVRVHAPRRSRARAAGIPASARRNDRRPRDR